MSSTPEGERTEGAPLTSAAESSTPDGSGGSLVPPAPPGTVACAGGIVHDEHGRLLLIRRGQPPAEGAWSVPGGRCEPGETAEEACARELAEETGLEVTVQGSAGRVFRDGPDGVTFCIDDFFCTATGGELLAATDASDARWIDLATYRELDRDGSLSPHLTDALTEWGGLPRA